MRGKPSPFETLCDILYLLIMVALSVNLLLKDGFGNPESRIYHLAGFMVVILILGDSFRFIPRITSFFIKDSDNVGTLHDCLSVMGKELLLKTLPSIIDGTNKRIPQDQSLVTFAPIIKKEMAHLDFNKTADEICNSVRGFYSWPCAFCFINGKRIKVISAKKSYLSSCECGVVIDNDNKIIISCSDGSVELVTVQPEGAKVMSAQMMLNGHKILKGTVVE